MSVSLLEVANASAAVAATRSRLAKVAAIAAVLSGAEPSEIPLAIAYLSGRPRQDKLGVGWAALRDEPPPPAQTPSLTLTEVDEAMETLAATAGAGASARRRRVLHGVLSAATESEQDFLRRLILRELRQGATEGLMIEAVASASNLPADDVRRAAMMQGSVVAAGVVALTQGAAGIAAVRLTLFRPIQPMLASTADGVVAALAAVDGASIEAKLDGARIQVHRSDADVRIFTRNLKEVTDRLPEVVELIGGLPVDSLILDGEVIALRRDGRPHPFQVTMGRFGSTLDVAQAQRSLPLTPFFFDVLHADGRDVLDLPLRERHHFLDRLPPQLLVRRLVSTDPDQAQRFLEDVLAAGHEGVVVKSLDAPYAAGRRGASWLKVKPAHTLDLVVLAAEWGSGRRRGRLSNLHLGARAHDGGFVMLGKTFKGLTDSVLEWQTARFLELETHREGHVVFVRPEQVVEIAFDGVQASTRYPGGMALRFARVKGYRGDKSAAQADTIETVRALFEGRRR